MPTAQRVDAAVPSEPKKMAEIFTKARQKKLGPKIAKMCRSKMGLPPLSTDTDGEPMDAETSATIAAVPLVAAKAASAAHNRNHLALFLVLLFNLCEKYLQWLIS